MGKPEEKRRLERSKGDGKNAKESKGNRMAADVQDSSAQDMNKYGPL